MLSAHPFYARMECVGLLLEVLAHQIRRLDLLTDQISLSDFQQEIFSLYPLSFTMNHLHIQFMKPAGSIVAGSLRFQSDIYSMASQPGKTTRPANTMMHHSSIEGGRERDAALAGMFHNLPPLHDFRHSSLFGQQAHVYYRCKPR